MRIRSGATMLVLLFATEASAASIPLRPGDYGTVDLACDHQPNATILSFDGRSFSYPHASKCTDTIVMRSAGVLTIAETCRAAGDGSPATSDTDTFKLRRQGAERFALTRGTTTVSYRRCGQVGYFNKH